MKEKIRSFLCTAINAFIIAGIIILFIGSYYLIIKSGIPYQDPPLDLWMEYEVNAKIGDVLLGSGFMIAVCGGIIRLVFCLIWKMRQK